MLSMAYPTVLQTLKCIKSVACLQMLLRNEQAAQRLWPGAWCSVPGDHLPEQHRHQVCLAGFGISTAVGVGVRAAVKRWELVTELPALAPAQAGVLAPEQAPRGCLGLGRLPREERVWAQRIYQRIVLACAWHASVPTVSAVSDRP